jgi:tetratricopeptide (TPR) repeat protein
MLSREYERAPEEYRKLLEFDQYFYKVYNSIGRVYCQMGRYEHAIERFEKGRALCGDAPNILGALGQSYGLAGKIEKAKSLLDELNAMARYKHIQATCYALIHLGLGNKACALKWLEKGCGQRDTSLAAVGIHPAYDALRSEHRFNALLETIGLLDLKSA